MSAEFDLDEQWMRQALAEALAADREDEVPVGAVVVRGREIIGLGHDCKIALNDPTAHAEILALRQAAATLGDWRLADCTLYVTLEPCPMCAGAALMARVGRLVYGADNAKFGAIQTITRLLSPAPGQWNHQLQVTGGVLAEPCAAALSAYFSKMRRKKN